MKTKTISMFAMCLALAMFLIGCESMNKMEHAEDSLYHRLGGKNAITAVVDDFVGNVAADNRINGFFAQANIPQLKQNLVDQICAGTGGPCAYKGRNMVDAHRSMAIKDMHFSAIVADLVKTLNKFNVPQKEQNELPGILGSMKGNIVNS